MLPLLLIRIGGPNIKGFIAQLPVEVVYADVPDAAIAQLPVEVVTGQLSGLRAGQLVVEVLRSMHCIIPRPPTVPVPVCPPVDLTGTASGGCVEVTDFTGTASGGCASAVDPL